MTRYRHVVIKGEHVEGEVEYMPNKWVLFSGTESLLKIRLAFDAKGGPWRRIWAASDGYGEPGYVPPQGHDWSGIRDSSDGAIAAMLEVTEKWAKKHKVVWPWRVPDAQRPRLYETFDAQGKRVRCTIPED